MENESKELPMANIKIELQADTGHWCSYEFRIDVEKWKQIIEILQRGE